MPDPTPREELLARVLADATVNGLGDRSLREIATSVGTSHRMLNYHFGGREGLVAAVVAAVEAQQMAALDVLAGQGMGPADLMRALWRQVSDPQLHGAVALFFEVLAAAAQGRPGTEGHLDRLVGPWVARATAAAREVGATVDPVELQLGMAVTRGLLVQVLAEGDAAPATAAFERFVTMWEASSRIGQTGAPDPTEDP